MSGTYKIAVGDSDSLIAVISQKDINHEKAIAILRRFIAEKIDLIYPAAIIAETITTLTRKYKDPTRAGMIINQLLKGQLKIVDTTDLILKLAGAFYDEKGNPKDTFFDAVVAATAMVYDTKIIFSFDRFYPKMNLLLAEGY